MAVMAADPKGVSITPILSRVMPIRRRDASYFCRREPPSSWQKRRQASTLPGLMGFDITTPDISGPPRGGPASPATELLSHRHRVGLVASSSSHGSGCWADLLPASASTRPLSPLGQPPQVREACPGICYFFFLNRRPPQNF